MVGTFDGAPVGTEVVGVLVGKLLGLSDGFIVGFSLGS